MVVTNPVGNADSEFLALLEEYSQFEQPDRGDMITGTIRAIDDIGMIIDVRMKRDAVVSRNDLDRLEGMTFEVGQEIQVVVIHHEDQDGNMVVSVSQARAGEDWVRAEALMNAGEIHESIVADANRGGLIVPFGNLRGFIPASHVADLPRGLDDENRKDFMMSFIGKPIIVKIIEVSRKRRRLVMSQRDAARERRDSSKESLLENLKEGEVRRGRVSGLRDFGAFVDLGGADGLIHISELAWCRVKLPREVLNVGDEIDVYILRLDQDTKRIGLSLKRLQPNPWSLVDTLYHVGQVVEGTVSRVAQFGAFVSLEPGIEALLHANQITDPAPEDPTLHLRDGEKLLMRVISIESHRQRLGLSLKDVTDEERERWAAGGGVDEPEAGQQDIPNIETPDELSPVESESV